MAGGIILGLVCYVQPRRPLCLPWTTSNEQNRTDSYPCNAKDVEEMKVVWIYIIEVGKKLKCVQAFHIQYKVLGEARVSHSRYVAKPAQKEQEV